MNVVESRKTMKKSCSLLLSNLGMKKNMVCENQALAHFPSVRGLFENCFNSFRTFLECELMLRPAPPLSMTVSVQDSTKLWVALYAFAFHL